MGTSPHLSVCEWLLKVVGFSNLNLSGIDSPKLLALRETFETDLRYTGLRNFVKSGTAWRDVEGLDTINKIPALPVKGTHTILSPSRLLRDLLVTFVGLADVVCTTPIGSEQKPYKSFKKTADTVVLDEARGVSRGDALVAMASPRAERRREPTPPNCHDILRIRTTCISTSSPFTQKRASLSRSSSKSLGTRHLSLCS